LITVDLKQDHIDKGEKGSCYSCALALAFRELFPKATTISVSYITGKNKTIATILIDNKNYRFFYHKGDLATQIKNWDQNLETLVPAKYDFVEGLE